MAAEERPPHPHEAGKGQECQCPEGRTWRQASCKAWRTWGCTPSSPGGPVQEMTLQSTDRGRQVVGTHKEGDFKMIKKNRALFL